MCYRVHEIFYSLQGEGARTGRPAAFVRFSGCNLRCPFCDTDADSYEELAAADILSRLQSFPTSYVVLTGGEPALQVDSLLVAMLHEAGYTVAIETNGTVALPDAIDWVTLSPKEERMPVLDHADELKVVFIGQDVERYARAIRASHYYLQPCATVVDGRHADNSAEVVAYCMEHPHWSLSLQTHKLLQIP